MARAPERPDGAENKNTEEATPERDFGDSAGFGSGGSTLDRHEIGDVDPTEKTRPNPLDAVIKPPPSKP